MTILDHVWLVRLFEKSRAIQMIAWIHFSCYVQKPFLLRLFHNIGITSYSWPGQIYSENGLCFFIAMLKLPVQSKEVQENKQTKKGSNLNAQHACSFWVCCLCIALLNVKGMIPAQMGGMAKRGTKTGILCFLSPAQILLHVCSFIVVFFSLK